MSFWATNSRRLRSANEDRSQVASGRSDRSRHLVGPHPGRGSNGPPRVAGASLSRVSTEYCSKPICYKSVLAPVQSRGQEKNGGERTPGAISTRAAVQRFATESRVSFGNSPTVSRTENARRGGNGGGRETEIQHSLEKWPISGGRNSSGGGAN